MSGKDPHAKLPLPIGKTILFSDDEKDTDAWSHVDCTTFRVRKGPDYARNKEKEASQSALYDIFAVDVFTTSQKVKDIGSYVKLPPNAVNDEKELGVPSILIVHQNIPDYSPPNPMWGKAKDDGDGFLLTMYFKLTDFAREELAKDWSEVPAVNLLKNFLRSQPESDYRQRLKGIARVLNLPEVSLNGLAKKLTASYNETPFMIRTTLTYAKGPGYVELDVDVHRFSYMALVGLNGIKEKLSQVIWDLAFVLQGEPDDELPERMLGGARLRKLTLKNAKRFPTELLRKQ